MVRKKRNSKQFSSKQIFITLLIVLIVAFGAIFLFSGDSNVAGQAIGADFVGKPVLLKTFFDQSFNLPASYLCSFDSIVGNNKLNACTTYNDAQGTVWVVKKASGDYNHVIHEKSGKYLCVNKKYPGSSVSFCDKGVSDGKVTTDLWEFVVDTSSGGYDLKDSFGRYIGTGKDKVDYTNWKKNYHKGQYAGKGEFYDTRFSIISLEKKEGNVCLKKGELFKKLICLSKNDGLNKWSDNPLYVDPSKKVNEDSKKECTPEGVSKDKKELCYNKEIVKCDDWKKPENYDGKYFCPGIAPYEWLVCGGSENKNSIDKDGNRYCDGKVWINCNTEQSKKDWGEALFCDAKSDEWNLCNINTKDTLSIKGSLCDGSKWVDCDNPHADTSSSDGKYTCDGNIWETTEEINYDLQSGFEVRFTKEKPADVKGFGGLLSFCDTDNQHIDNFLVTCINKVPLTKVLDKDILYPTTIGQENVAFLYQYKDDQKIGSVFLRKDLSPKELDYEANEFVDAMVKGRRIALQFENQIYLLEHPKSNLFSLQNLKMKIYEDSTEETYDAKGSPNKVEFILPEGKITVQLDTSGNAGFYKLSALTKSQIVSQEIDLNEELSVKMSSEYGVKITDNPNFGIVKVNEDPKTGDSNLEAEFFKIVVEKEDKKYILEKNVPKVIKKGDVSALFYYDTINKQTNKAIKSLQIFQHFDLSKNKFHDYNNEFIKTFTGGNEFVVQYGKGYYRVGYAEKPTDQVTLFSLQKLILTSLDGKNKYVPKEANSKKVTFIVPEGGVVFEKKVDDNKLEFYKQTAVELTTQEFNADDYSTFLTKETPVKVNKVTYQLKDSGFTSTLDTQARIIEGNNEDTFKVLKKDQVEPIDGHLFWFKGKNAKGLKEISVQPIVEIKEGQKKTIDDWGDILAKAKDAKSKAILWQGEYFDLVGDKKLASYSLRSIPEGDTFPIKNIKVADDETENGTFAFHEHLLFATQVLDLKTTEASLELTPLTHKLLTSTGLNSTSHGKTLSFVTTVGGPLYVMTHSTVNKNLFVVGSLFTPAKSFLKMLIPEGKSTKILFPDLTLGTIEVLNTTTSEIRITK